MKSAQLEYNQWSSRRLNRVYDHVEWLKEKMVGELTTFTDGTLHHRFISAYWNDSCAIRIEVISKKYFYRFLLTAFKRYLQRDYPNSRVKIEENPWQKGFGVYLIITWQPPHLQTEEQVSQFWSRYY